MRIALMNISLLISLSLYAQEKEEARIVLEQKMENQMEKEEADMENDDYLQLIDYFRKHPINLNDAVEDDLKSLQLLNDLQLSNFFRYRNLLGNLIDIHELQSIPGWDIATIKVILPFVIVKDPSSFSEKILQRLHGGDNSLLIRYGRNLKKTEEYLQAGNPGSHYEGSPSRILFRYKYQYKNLLQAGITGDKDAGESFFRKAQKKGFDFYSIHLFARQIGSIKAIALGDYTINFGQGLAIWQGLAFRKSAAVLNIKRQGPALRPYNSSGEFYFHRGAAIHWQHGRWEAVAFVSNRKLSANEKNDSSQYTGTFITSIQTSGYHRTPAELLDRNRVKMVAYGGMLSYRWSSLRIGLNAVAHQFSLPVYKEPEPYNLFSFSGDKMKNYSIDYSYTFRNIHVFGETAIDNKSNLASLNGLLASIDPRIDIALVQRTISRAYQSFFGNAFTENSSPSNENGWYAAISIRPTQTLRIDGYMDIFKFPWLTAPMDAPSFGKEYFVQFNYTPTKQLDLYSRIRWESKSSNVSNNMAATPITKENDKINWRIQVSYILNKAIEVRNRTELVWFGEKGKVDMKRGFLGYADIFYKPARSFFSGNLRLQYFEMDDYDCRIYAYENDIAYSNTVPAYYNKGFHYYINCRADVRRILHLRTSLNMNFYSKIAQTIVTNADSLEIRPHLISDKNKTELKFQLLLGW